MYRCSHCEETFSEPAVDRQRFDSYTYGDGAVCDTQVCPYCGYDDFHELNRCIECGSPDDLIGGLCEFCREEAENKLTTLLLGEFTLRQLNYLIENYDKSKLERIIHK